MRLSTSLFSSNLANRVGQYASTVMLAAFTRVEILSACREGDEESEKRLGIGAVLAYVEEPPQQVYPAQQLIPAWRLWAAQQPIPAWQLLHVA